MNIGLDSAAILASMNRGIGNYTIDLYRMLLTQGRANNWYLINWSQESLRSFFSVNENLVEVCIGKKSNANPLYYLNHEDELKTAIKVFIKNYKIDLFLMSNPFDMTMPPYHRHWFGRTKTVAIVYDLIPYIFKKDFLREEEAYIDYMKHADALKEYDYILTDSKSAKQDVSHMLGIPSWKIATIYAAVNAVPHTVTDEEEERFVKERFGIKGKYLLSVTGVGKSKNVKGLIQAFGKAVKTSVPQYQLVITCKVTRPIKKTWECIAKEAGVSDLVIFTDYVQPIELQILYRGATWVIMTSLYEGFGLPVLEAWNYSVPVMTSNNSSLGEISRGAAVQVNPYSISSMASGLIRLMNMEEDERRKYIDKGECCLGKFSWEKTAKKTLRAMEMICLKARRRRFAEYVWNSGIYQSWMNYNHRKEYEKDINDF